MLLQVCPEKIGETGKRCYLEIESFGENSLHSRKSGWKKLSVPHG